MLPSPVGKAEDDSQNLYLVLASSTGFAGLAAYLGMLGFFGVSALRRFVAAADPFERGLALGLAGSCLAFAVNSLWSPLLVRGIGIPLALVFALCLPPPEHVPEPL
jgi:hypothetical protein